jgi:short chain dehydrogenase
VRELAARLTDGRLDPAALAALADDELIAMLTEIPGIGPWTAQGALIIALGREDVVLPGDLALRKAVRTTYRLDHLPTAEEVLAIAEKMAALPQSGDRLPVLSSIRGSSGPRWEVAVMNTRVAIVAGAGGALGRATSKAVGSGFTVVAVDRKEQGLRELSDGIRLEVADATDPAVPRPLVDRIAGMVGPPEVLVNTIGAFEVGDALAATPETLSRMIDVNLGAARESPRSGDDLSPEGCRAWR